MEFLQKTMATPESLPWRIQHVPRQTEIPLSSGQSRLWFADKLIPHSAASCLSFAYQVEGPVDRLLLERALSEIVRRHEILRTCFVSREAKPYQTVLEPSAVVASYVDLSTLNESDRQRVIETVRQEESKTPFNLEAPPLFRVTLIAQVAESYLLLFTIHHIISDAWSMDVLKHELSALYSAFSQGQPSPLLDLPLQYADYAAWQSGIDFKNGEPRERLDYWRRTLAGAPALLELPTDRPRTAERTSAGQAVQVNLSGYLLERLTKLGQKEHCSLFVTLLALFAVLLHRYTGQEDICIGAPMPGRTTPEFEQLIGVFVNSVVFRFDLTNNPSVRSLLRQTRERVMDGLEYQDVPFEQVVEALNPERTAAYAPLFQAAFAFRDSARTPNTPSENSIREIATSGLGPAMCDITLNFSQSCGKLAGWLEYSCDLFDEEMIERMVQHYINLLSAACDDAEAVVGSLPMLSAPEKSKILEAWNETAAPFDSTACIHDLVVRQMLRSPDAVAVVDAETTLTYRELDVDSSYVAHRLAELGVQPGVQVAVCMQRSAAMIAALIGVLKTGAAYVPVDPAYPDARAQFILDDTTPVVVVCDDVTSERFAKRYNVLNVSRWRGVLAPEATPATLLSCRPSDTAYIIYTSGSTGQPKGVEIEHRSAVAFLTFAVKLFGEDLRTTLASTSVCFDPSILEIFAPLMTGGTVVMVKDVTELLAMRSTFPSQITFVHTVPSAMGELLKTPSMLEGIRTFSLGGEPLPTSLVRDLYLVAGVQRVFDVYGPTETTTFSTCGVRDSEGPPTVGRPIDNTSIYILDRYRNPVPVGVAGELFIAGAGVARGYWRRPVLTSERFVEDPFKHDATTRMYKTGDQARYRNDGNIEILGRFDDQVKIRGYRIELGEVEHVLFQHPAVRDCGAAVAISSNGAPRLIACVALNSESATPDSIQQFAAQLLPSYMTPGKIFIRDSIPRTTSGKIDRKRIGMLWGDKDAASMSTSPNNPVEAELLTIWSSIFPGQIVGTQDNFFDLGGHSLLALRMLHKIEAVCGQKLSLSVFLHAQNIEKLAPYLHHGRAFATWNWLVPLRTTGSGLPLFLVHGSGGSMLAYKDLLEYLPADQIAYGLQYSADSFDPIQMNSVEKLAAQFVEEIRQVQPHGPYHLLGHCAGGSIVYEMACLLTEQGESVGFVGLLEAFQRPFKLRLSVRALRRAELIREHIAVLLQDDKRGSYVKVKLQKLGRELAIGIQRLIAPQTQTNPGDLEEAMLTFVPRSYGGPVHLFRSLESAAEFCEIPYDYGWSQSVSGRMTVHELPGDHLTLLRVPHVHVLCEVLSKILIGHPSLAVV